MPHCTHMYRGGTPRAAPQPRLCTAATSHLLGGVLLHLGQQLVIVVGCQLWAFALPLLPKGVSAAAQEACIRAGLTKECLSLSDMGARLQSSQSSLHTCLWVGCAELLFIQPGSHQQRTTWALPATAASVDSALPCTCPAASQLSSHAVVAHRPPRHSLEGLHLQQVGAQRLGPSLGLRVLQQTHGQLALTQQHRVRIVHLQRQGSRGNEPGFHTAAEGSIGCLQVSGSELCQSAWRWRWLTAQTNRCCRYC